MTSRPLPLLAVLASVVAVTGCGASASEQVAQAPPAPAATPVAAVDAGVTAAETGDASSASSESAEESVSPGGPVSPDVALAPRTDQEGVGAGKECPGAADLPSADGTAANDAATLCLINNERTARGMVALTPDPKLAAAAKAFAASMVKERFFSHTGVDGSTLTSRVKKTGYMTGKWTVGENLAWGSGELATPNAIVAAWMDSPGHRANILTPGFRHIGLALEMGTPNGEDEGATYVNEFGANGTAPVAKKKKKKTVTKKRR